MLNIQHWKTPHHLLRKYRVLRNNRVHHRQGIRPMSLAKVIPSRITDASAVPTEKQAVILSMKTQES
ncbi:hypothetical protein ACOSQ4_017917 [Xanthoceras sorbifolium]